jgi:hypothetical protein
MNRCFSLLRVALAVATIAAPTLAMAQGDLPTAPKKRINPTSGYGSQSIGGEFLDAPGSAGSVGLSNTKAEMKNGATVSNGAPATGMGGLSTPGYGNRVAGAATAYHRLPEVVEAADLLTPQQRAARAILPGAHQPLVGQ